MYHTDMARARTGTGETLYRYTSTVAIHGTSYSIFAFPPKGFAIGDKSRQVMDIKAKG